MGSQTKLFPDTFYLRANYVDIESDNGPVYLNELETEKALIESELTLPHEEGQVEAPLTIRKTLDQKLISVSVTGALTQNNLFLLALRRVGAFVEWSVRMTPYQLLEITSAVPEITSAAGLVPLEYRPRGFTDEVSGARLRISGYQGTAFVGWLMTIKSNGAVAISNANGGNFSVGVGFSITDNGGSYLTLV